MIEHSLSECFRQFNESTLWPTNASNTHMEEAMRRGFIAHANEGKDGEDEGGRPCAASSLYFGRPSIQPGRGMHSCTTLHDIGAFHTPAYETSTHSHTMLRREARLTVHGSEKLRGSSVKTDGGANGLKKKMVAQP